MDRVRGVIIGSALGDAIGLYTEFLTREMSLSAYPEGRFQLVSPATELANDGHRSMTLFWRIDNTASNANIFKISSPRYKSLPLFRSICLIIIGSWTDDTDHALLIILSCLHNDGQLPVPSDLAVRLRF